jgi:Phage capsid family
MSAVDITSRSPKMSLTNWTTSRLQQDGAGQYFGGGPWGGQYGSGSNAQTSSFSSSPYWGMQVFVSTVVGPGTALVGSTQAATVWRRGRLTVSASDSHNDFFVRNLHMLRAEERLALAVYRPSAFCAVTGLT